MRTEETQNTKVVGDFPTFPQSGKAPAFNIGRKSSSLLSEERIRMNLLFFDSYYCNFVELKLSSLFGMQK
jgi:hypothetical protein